MAAAPNLGPLPNPIINQPFDDVPNLPAGFAFPIQGLGLNFEELINVAPEYTRLLHRGGLMANPNQAVFGTAMILSQTDKVHGWVKSVKIDHILRLFMELFIPGDVPVPGDLTVAQIHCRVLEEMRAQLREQNGHFNDQWAPLWRPAPGGAAPDDRPIEMRNADGAIQWVLNTAPPVPVAEIPALLVHWPVLAECYVSENKAAKNEKFLRRVFEMVIAMCKMGTVSERKLESIHSQINDELRVVWKLQPEDYIALWKELIKVVRACNLQAGIPAILRQLYEMIPIECNIRMHLTLRQAPHSGVSAVTIISQAYRMYINSPALNWAEQTLTQECINFRIAARQVARNSFVALRDARFTEIVKNTRYPNLYYLAIQLLHKIAGDKHVARVIHSGSCQHKRTIDKLIQAIADVEAEDFDLARWAFDDGVNAADSSPDFGNILESLA